MRKILIFLIFTFNFNTTAFSKNDLYKKIDLFGEVIENIKNIYFIIGSDNLIKFHEWKSWKNIIKLVKLIVFSRRGYDRKGMKSMVVKNFKNKIIFIKNKHIAISSSQLKSQTKSNN